MFNIKLNKLHSFTAKSEKIPWALANHAFLMMVALILVMLATGGMLFYQYAFLTPQVAQDTVEKNMSFGYTSYTQVLNFWKTREESLEAYNKHQYDNPFSGTLSSSPTAEESEEIEN